MSTSEFSLSIQHIFKLKSNNKVALQKYFKLLNKSQAKFIKLKRFDQYVTIFNYCFRACS